MTPLPDTSAVIVRAKRLAVMQPYLFPYLGYFHLMHAVDRFVVLDDVNYIKGGWLNRNRILVGGTPHRFTLPLQHASQHRKIVELERADDARWRGRFLRMLEHSYRKSPFFADGFDIATRVIEHPERQLSAWIVSSIRRVCEYITLHTTIVPSSAVYRNAHLPRLDRIIDICRQETASCYVNAPGGRTLYPRETFAGEAIDLRFVQPRFPAYPQFGAPFVPGLSILDALMFNHPDEIRQRLFTYDLA